jgi:hypothetical protein
MSSTESLKSATTRRPKNLTAESHRALKQDVMKAAKERGNVRFCAQVTLHELARNQTHDDRVLWGANTILGKFNTFLGEQRSHGFAILDRMPVKSPYDYLKEKFQVGMTFDDRPSARFDRILGFLARGRWHLAPLLRRGHSAWRFPLLCERTRQRRGRQGDVPDAYRDDVEADSEWQDLRQRLRARIQTPGSPSSEAEGRI